MTPIPDPSFGPRIVPIPRLAAGGRWRVEAMRSLREPVLLWFTQGQGRITLSGVTRGYGAHNAVFIPARTLYGFEMVGRVFGNAVFFGHEPQVSLPGAPLHLRVREVAPQNELNAILENTQRELTEHRPGSERAVQYHLGLLGVWLERQATLRAVADASATSRPDAARRLTERYARLLERDFSSGMNVADFAAALNVTPTHLSRACKASCGRPAHALLQDRVLFEARKLLADTGLPIKDVARQLGFASPAYFTRAFQAQVGKTPSAFRHSR